MYCLFCGKEVDDRAIRCLECGRQIRASIPDTRCWSAGEMICFIIGSLLIPFSGIIFGMMNMKVPLRRTQAMVLIVISSAIIILLVISYYLMPFIFMFFRQYPHR